ncbi:MAG: hypothetical protein JWN84_1628 [Nocardioides sp.]|nr:hypothetical protein [Nocardioides sp.]
MSATDTTDSKASESTARRGHSGRHPVNIGHLVMGVAFTGLLVVWALVAGDVVEGEDVRWLLPVPWVLAGVAGLVGLIASDRRRIGQQQVGWVDTDEH